MSRSGRWTLPGLGLLLVWVTGGCSAWEEERGLAGRLEGVSPWPAEPVRCAGIGESGAADLAREARATWSRAGFDLADGPVAVYRMEQAMACAERDGDLGALDRWSAERRRWKSEVDATLRRARLSFALAERHQQASALALHARRLSALLSLADGEPAGTLRSELQRIERRARAQQQFEDQER